MTSQKMTYKIKLCHYGVQNLISINDSENEHEGNKWLTYHPDHVRDINSFSVLHCMTNHGHVTIVTEFPVSVSMAVVLQQYFPCLSKNASYCPANLLTALPYSIPINTA